MSTRLKVLMQAVPFCFGPISTSLAIASELRKMGAEIIWLAEGTSIDLLTSGQYPDHIINFSLSNSTHKTQYASLVKEADIVVVNTDPDFANFAIGLNDKTVYVDILYWMWNDLPIVVHKCALYIYEDFIRSDEQIERIGLPLRSFRVGPLTNLDSSIPTRHSGAVGKHLLVSLGGLLRPDSNSRNLLISFKEMIFNAIVMALQNTNSFAEVYFAGGGIEKQETILPNGIKILSGCLAREEHQQVMATAKSVVMSPGLTGFYEVAATQTPVFFLPPHNYSQHLQLQTYKSVLHSSCYSDWSRLGLRKEMKCFLPEDQMLNEVDETLISLSSKSDILAQHLLEFFTLSYDENLTFPAFDLLKMLESRNPKNGAYSAAQAVFNLAAELS